MRWGLFDSVWWSMVLRGWKSSSASLLVQTQSVVCVCGGSHTEIIVHTEIEIIDGVVLEVWSAEKNWSCLPVDDRRGCILAWKTYHTTAHHTARAG